MTALDLTESRKAKLNKQQDAAIRTTKSALILSGAGTGKTRVIAARIAWLIDNGVSVDNILAATFTNKAAGEMKSRVGLDPMRASQLFIGTFHSMCAKILRMHPEEAGLPSNFRILDSGDQLAAIRSILRDDLGMPTQANGGPDPRDIRNAISARKEAGLRSNVDSPRMQDPIARDVYGIYEQRMRTEGKADFAELLLRCNEMLEEFPDVRRQWANRFQHVLIDELQDINHMQLNWIKLLRTSKTVYFGVGDDDQSIYAFRGADPQTMENFEREYAGGNVLRLELNYRSSKSILQLANNLISDNSRRIGKKLVGTRDTGSIPRFICSATDSDEASSISSGILALADKGVSMSDIAVFYRNHYLSQVIEHQLQKDNIPYRVRGSLRFYDRLEVRQTIAYLAAANNPEDDAAILATINAPKRGIGAAMIAKLRAAAGDKPLWHAVCNDKSAKIADYVERLNKIREKRDSGLQAIAQAVAEHSGLIEYYASRGASEKERIEQIKEVVNAATAFAESESESLDSFLAYVSLGNDPNESQDANLVSLMTIHAAKGLEYDYVFIAGLEDGILPPFHAFDSHESIAEERRLLYVAITRARIGLTLSCAQMRRIAGRFRPVKPSSLLMKLNRKSLELVNFGMISGSSGQVKAPLLVQDDTTPSAAGSFKVGQIVSHRRFGKGAVLAFAGSGTDTKVRVQFFDSAERKWLMLNLAKLEPASKRS